MDLRIFYLAAECCGVAGWVGDVGWFRPGLGRVGEVVDPSRW